MGNHKAEYLEVAIGGVENRNHIIHYSELPGIVKANPDKEVFRSYYFFDETRKHHKGPARDYMGRRYVRDLHLDYDGESALEMTRTMYEKLWRLGVDKDLIWVWFSGSKGFHIWIPDVFGFTPSALVHQDVRNTLSEFAPGVDLKPMSANGLIRAEWSYHAGSGLYKTLIPIEMLSENVIWDQKEFAGKPPVSYMSPLNDLGHYTEDKSTPLSDYKTEDLERDIAPVKTGSQKNSTYFGCMTKLWNRGPVEGRRHQDLLRQITYWRHIGLTAEQAFGLGTIWTDTTDWGVSKSRDEVGKMVNWAYETAAYHHSCSTDIVMLEFCIGERCPLYKYRNQQTEAETMQSAMDKYRESLFTDHGGFDLSEIYGEGVKYSVRAGEVALLLADTKIGKSSLFLNWAVKLSRFKWLIITPEMKVEDMVERTLQIKYGLRVNDSEGINEVADLAIHGNGQFDTLLEKVDHIHWITSPPFLEDMGRIVAQQQPDVVIIDPLEMIHTKGGGEREDVALANGLRLLANQHRVPLLVVHHINKSGQREGGSTELEPWMSKGFKRIQEQVDHVWKMEGSHDKPYRRLSRLMGRRPQSLNVLLVGDVETFRFEKEVL